MSIRFSNSSAAAGGGTSADSISTGNIDTPSSGGIYGFEVPSVAFTTGAIYGYCQSGSGTYIVRTLGGTTVGAITVTPSGVTVAANPVVFSTQPVFLVAVRQSGATDINTNITLGVTLGTVTPPVTHGAFSNAFSSAFSQ